MQNDFKPRRRQVEPLAAEDIQTHEPEIITPTGADKPAEPAKPDFEAPEQVAANDDLKPEDKPIVTIDEGPKTKGRFARGNWKEKLKLSWPPGRKEAIVAALVAVLLGCTSTAIALLTSGDAKAPAPKKAVVKVAPKPTTVASILSGLQVKPELNAKPVTGIMIENSTDARPQSGLSQASVVFEAIAEGGITRFLTLFQDTSPESIGPVRSARPYYAQWALGFDAGYAHVGGSPEALASIKTWGVRDLDQFANSGSYERISSRVAPHNVYTSIAKLNELEATKGYTSSKFTGFTRKAEAAAKVPNAKAINLAISGPVYNVHYDYAPATNSYNRSEGGAAHMDANGNVQISPKVVIGLVVPFSIASDGTHSQYAMIGTGAATIFQDGTVTTGTWSKPDNATQVSFTDAAGKPIKLNPGQTWITAVGSADKISFTP